MYKSGSQSAIEEHNEKITVRKAPVSFIPMYKSGSQSAIEEHNEKSQFERHQSLLFPCIRVVPRVPLKNTMKNHSLKGTSLFCSDVLEWFPECH